MSQGQMSSEMTSVNQIREITTRLGQPIPDIKLLKSLLAAPLACFGVLPPQYQHHVVNPISVRDIKLSRHVPALQRVILDKIYPTWEHALAQDNETILLEQYFCPDTFSYTSFAAGQISLLAYSTILSSSLSSTAVSLLARLTREYPVDRLHLAVVSTRDNNSPSARDGVTWEDCVRNLCAVPSKVTNFVSSDGDLPEILEHQVYFTNLSIRCEHLIRSLSASPSRGAVCCCYGADELFISKQEQIL
jgi:telomere length regulation protein